MLSNTATPKYYGMFRDSVLRGEIPVNREIEMEMNRIDALIRNPAIWYDDEAVEGYIRYCENELTLNDGSDLHLVDSFKLWAEQLLSWYYFIEKSVFVLDSNGKTGHYENRVIKKRLRKKQYIIVSRGAAKTFYGSTIHSYFLNIDTSTTRQIATAPTVRQANEVLAPIKTSIARSKGPLFKFLTEGSAHNTTGSKYAKPKLLSTKDGIKNVLTESTLEVIPMSIDKLQGFGPKIATVDEWLSCEVRENPIGAIEQGCSKNDEYIILSFSSEGTVRNGVGDDIKMELMSILKGEYIADHVSIFYYKMDSVEEISNPSLWLKCNPNLGKTVQYEAYQDDLERAEKVPSQRNDILAKRFGIPSEGLTYFFSYEETKKFNPQNYLGMACSLGADISQGDDFCSFAFLFPLSREMFGIRTRNYISEVKLAKVAPSMRLKYEEFIDEGSLIVMNKVNLDIQEIYDDLDAYIQRNGFDVRSFGYDPYNARVFVENYTRDNGPFGIEKVIQGRKTESVPLGELKNLSERRMLIFDESIMSFAIGNCIVIEDNNGNRMLSKRRHDEKIDPVAATMDAFIAYKNHKDLFN